MSLENSADLDVIYRLAGICAHHCANIEYSMSFLLVPKKYAEHQPVLDLEKAQTQSWEEWFEAKKEFDSSIKNMEKEIDKLDDLALGALIQQVNEKYRPPEAVIGYLNEIRMKRNYVIHKIWAIYGKRLKDPVAAKKMFHELQEHEHFLRDASKWIRQQAMFVNGTFEELDIRRSQKYNKPL